VEIRRKLAHSAEIFVLKHRKTVTIEKHLEKLHELQRAVNVHLTEEIALKEASEREWINIKGSFANGLQ
jgi:hypothetical protein